MLNTLGLVWADGKPKPDNTYGVAPVAEGGDIWIFGGWGKTRRRGCGA